MLGVAVTVVRNAPPAPSAAPVPLSWPEGVCRVLSVGRLVDQKGFDRALRALASPAVRALPWHWNIIGEGEARDTLMALAATLGLASRVSFVGARPAVDGLCKADLVLAPSRFEGMPLVPLEAAEAGVMVLASRIAAHEELYEQTPEALLDTDEARWPETLQRCLGDAALRARVFLAQRAVLGDNPRRATYTAYEALYRDLLKRS
jgi:glycosyltransferase involved in cell wall biosynthesis